ncbi:ABC transporter substrate-binding protein [Litorivicinus sp.]|nr:ABC transporter substrate-binding protein [Litorivicinus sp.]
MRFLLSLIIPFSLSVLAQADSDPKAATASLFVARDAFYADVSKFRAGDLSEEQLVQRIAEQFIPLIDDRKIALRVMGRFARQATEDQRKKFTVRLQSSLVDTYARGLAAYGGERLVLPEEAMILRTGRARVEAKLESPGKDPLPIQFALGYDEKRGWIVENVVIAGINLGLTLRNQFADLVRTSGSVDGAINAWTLSVGGSG